MFKCLVNIVYVKMFMAHKLFTPNNFGIKFWRAKTKFFCAMARHQKVFFKFGFFLNVENIVYEVQTKNRI